MSKPFNLSEPPLDQPDLVRCFLANAEHRPDKICLHFIENEMTDVTSVTFGEMAHQARAFAHYYQATGLRAGDLVLIFLDHHRSLYASFLGALMVGCIPSFMPCPSPNQDPKRYWSSHKTLLERIEPGALVAEAVHLQAMQENGLVADKCVLLDVNTVSPADLTFEIGDFDPAATAFLQHSSGTTGLKKGVALSHQAVINQINAYAPSLGASPDDTVVSWLPVYHDMGLIACMIMPLMTGQTTVMMAPLKWASRPVMIFEAIQAYHGRYVWMPNFAFEHLSKTTGMQDPCADLSQVTAFISCSEPCKLATVNRFVETFASWGLRRTQMQMCYAMAENVFAATQTKIGSEPSGATPDGTPERETDGSLLPQAMTSYSEVASVGVPISGVNVTVRDVKGEPVKDGIVGEVTLSGSSLFDGYFRQPDVTAERLKKDYYRTCDLGFKRGDELFVLGRMDDLIIANGKNFYAHDLEAIVSDVEGIKPGRCVAFGVFNEALGSEEIIIIAQAHPENEEPETRLKRAIKKSVFDDCGLIIKESRIVSADWLVKTSSGKISREANRAKYMAEKGA